MHLTCVPTVFLRLDQLETDILLRVGIVEDSETDNILNELAQKEVGDDDLYRLQEQTGTVVFESPYNMVISLIKKCI